MATWLSSRLKAAEQFLNQIDATAADRAQKAKDKAADTDSRFGSHFSRTASELSFTDEGRTSGQSADESSEAGQRQRVRPLNQPSFNQTGFRKELGARKKEAPAAADWTELLKGREKDRPADVTKLFRSTSNVKRNSRVSKGEESVAQPPILEQNEKTVLKTEGESLLLPAESSTGSAVTVLGKQSNDDDVISKRTSTLDEAVSEWEKIREPDLPSASKSVDAKAGLLPVEKEPADSKDSQKAEPGKGMPRINSGLEAVIPTSDSEEETTSAESGESAKGEKEAPGQEVAGGQPGPVLEKGPETVLQHSKNEARESESIQDRSPPEIELTEAAQSGDNITDQKASLEPEVDHTSTVQAGTDKQETDSKEGMSMQEKPQAVSSRVLAKVRSLKDFSMREYMGRDLSVKEVETEGVDSDADASESGSDDETDSDSDNSEDERAERQKQKEEEERQAIERQKAAAAAAALEVSAAETAVRAVKEREEVIALLEKEKEELQIEAAEASERHAKEIARLRASATAGSKAATVEKSSHSSTRMQTYSKEEQLVMENVEKAKALAAAQRALDEVVTKALEARRKVEERELHRAGLQKRLEETHQRLHRLQADSKQDDQAPSTSESPLSVELDRAAAKMETKRQRVVELEERLNEAANQKREPSEQEKELERRLQSLTDHLIQKQAQVEALASEKATLALRLETVASTLQEEEKGDGPFRKRGKQTGRHSTPEWWLEDDLEYGSAETSTRTGKHGQRSGFDSDTEDDEHDKKRRGNILPGFVVTAIQQFDDFTVGGGRFLRVNTPARVLLALYLLMLHAWVLLVWSVHASGTMGEGVHELASSLPGNKDALSAPTETLASVRRLSPLFAYIDT